MMPGFHAGCPYLHDSNGYCNKCGKFFHRKENMLIRAALGFWIMALISIILGASHIGGVTFETGRALLFVFMILAVVSFVAGIISSTGRNGRY